MFTSYSYSKSWHTYDIHHDGGVFDPIPMIAVPILLEHGIDTVQLPVGLQGLIEVVMELTSWDDLYFSEVLVDSRGLLRITPHVRTPGPISLRSQLHLDIAWRVLSTIRRQSAILCWYCGNSGNRRRLEVGWPCLCAAHYVEYVNRLDDIRYPRPKDEDEE